MAATLGNAEGIVWRLHPLMRSAQLTSFPNASGTYIHETETELNVFTAAIIPGGRLLAAVLKFVQGLQVSPDRGYKCCAGKAEPGLFWRRVQIPGPKSGAINWVV